MIVLVVIGILATLGLVVARSARLRAHDAKSKSDVGAFIKGWIQLSGDSGRYVSQCSGSFEIKTTNIAGGASLSSDFLSNNLLAASVETTTIFGSTYPQTTPCAYSAANTTESVIAVGEQLTIGTGATDNIYPNNTIGGAIDSTFDTPNVGSLPWFVITQH